MKKITIKDIAKLGGVSIATVSKIINGKDHDIGEATKKRIELIMKEENYVPNRLARSLVTKKTKTIGLVIPDITNPFFPEIVRGAEDKAQEEGYSIFFCNSDDSLEKEEKYIQNLMEKMVDGIIFTASSKRITEGELLSNANIPMVLVDRQIESKNIRTSILVDNKEGAKIAIKHLIELGHKKILHLTGPKEARITQARLEGYKETLEESKIDIDENLIQFGEYKMGSGYEGILDILNRNIDFTAIFCGNDMIALGVMKALKEKKIKVPKDISIVGFDDIYVSSLIHPSLTTISQPKYQMGYKAVAVMIDILEGRIQSHENMILMPELKIRETTLNLKEKVK